jgi:TRAP-type C4-dicarboxylate transport system permease small subunit
MMFITFFNVIGRAAFNLPVRGYFESVEFAMVLMTVFGIGYCALSKGHIRVDVLSSYASRRVNCVMDIFAFGTAFIFYVLVSWQGVLNALTYLKDGRTSSVLHIPVYPFIFLLVIGAAFVALVFFRDFLKAMYEVKR